MFALAVASLAYAEWLPFSEMYYDDFVEGEDITVSFGELDSLIFTYYGTNYTIRVLGIYSSSATVRVEMKALDMEIGETKDFDLDNDDIWDLSMTLSYTDSDEALLKLVLNKIEEEEPEENITNTTNTTSTNTTNTSNTSSQNQDNNSNHNNNNNESQNTTTTSNSNEQNTSTSSSKDDSKKNPEVTGDVVYNIEIDISIPPGSGIGVLLIMAIVLGGLFAYKKARKKWAVDKGGTATEKRVKKSPKTEQKEPIKAADMKKAFKKFMKKTGKTITHSRKKFAEMIAGEGFVRKPKS